MLRLFLLSAAAATIYGATTVPPVPKILYDFHHQKAMMVKADGCYEYHMNHQDHIDAMDDATRPTLEARMLAELATAINIQETGHHHIDHLTAEIKAACAAVPVYSWDIPQATAIPTAAPTASPVT